MTRPSAARSFELPQPLLDGKPAFVFDFDGVVAHVNVARVLSEARAHRESFLLEPERVLSEYFYDNLDNVSLDLGLTTVTEVREGLRPLLWRGTPQQWHAWWCSVEDAYELEPAMAEWLMELRRSHAMALLTDNHLGFRRWLARRPDIEALFDAVVCSAEIGSKKPSPVSFRRAAEALGRPLTSLIFVDDNLSNVRAARRQGIASVEFRSIEQARSEVDAILGSVNARGTRHAD